jgi:hypothetical protein
MCFKQLLTINVKSMLDNHHLVQMSKKKNHWSQLVFVIFRTIWNELNEYKVLKNIFQFM